MIRRVRVHGFKSLTNFEVELRPLTVIFGPNASGKSNFLDALQLLAGAAQSKSLSDAFQPPYRGKPLESFTLGAYGIEGASLDERLVFSIEADIEVSQSTVDRVERRVRELAAGNGSSKARGASVRERYLRYRLVIETTRRTGELRVAEEYLAALTAEGLEKKARKPFIETQGAHIFVRREGQGRPTDHAVGTDRTLLSEAWYAPLYPHINALKAELAEWAFFYFEPRVSMRAANPIKEVRHIGFMGEDLAAYLNTLEAQNRPQFKAIERALHTLVPRVDGIKIQRTAVGEVELQLIEDGIAVPARLVSEGTLRLLGLLAIASAPQPPTLVAFEEPENGLHPRRISLLARFLQSQTEGQDTQYIVTTHSPHLLDQLALDALYVCRRTDGRTTIEPFPDVGPIFRTGDRDDALNDEGDGALIPISERVLRGDFDG